MNKVVDRALSTIEKSCGGNFFRRSLDGVELDVTAGKEAVAKRKNRARESRSRHLTAAEKIYTDELASNLLRQVCETAKRSFHEMVNRHDLRGKLRTLDRLFEEQPELPGGKGRVPATMETTPEDLLRAKRMRIKTDDKKNLEMLLNDVKNVNAKLQTELDQELALVQQCMKQLDERASIIDDAHGACVAAGKNQP